MHCLRIAEAALLAADAIQTNDHIRQLAILTGQLLLAALASVKTFALPICLLLGLQPLPEGTHSTRGASSTGGASSEVRQQPTPQQPIPISLLGGNCTSPM